jgi:hypothetical protein
MYTGTLAMVFCGKLLQQNYTSNVMSYAMLKLPGTKRKRWGGHLVAKRKGQIHQEINLWK